MIVTRRGLFKGGGLCGQNKHQRFLFNRKHTKEGYQISLLKNHHRSQFPNVFSKKGKQFVEIVRLISVQKTHQNYVFSEKGHLGVFWFTARY